MVGIWFNNAFSLDWCVCFFFQFVRLRQCFATVYVHHVISTQLIFDAFKLCPHLFIDLLMVCVLQKLEQKYE